MMYVKFIIFANTNALGIIESVCLQYVIYIRYIGLVVAHSINKG